MKKRCSRCIGNELYEKYHDEERGQSVHDDTKLFEFLTLEWAQAGLSWITVLKKRENYRTAFDERNVEKIATYGEMKKTELMNNEWIIRNRLKIASAIDNAKAFLSVQKEFGSFDKYIWWFVNHTPIVNDIVSSSDVPAETDISRTMSKDLKKRWFRFVGPTICYAFMQAIGMVDDHLNDCWMKKKA